MSTSTPSDNFPNRFQRESLNLIGKLLPLSSSAFYLVGPDMQHRGVVLRNLEAEAERLYVEKFAHLDPLNPALFEHGVETVVCTDEIWDARKLLASEYYKGFMAPLNHRHVADMFFRRDGGIVAVLSMLRDASLGAFGKEELGLLRKLQPFLEYTLNTVYLPRRHMQRRHVSRDFGLTEREVDVVELIVAGASNKVIARDLGLGLATVKTHIQHVFQKMEISSRTELSAKVLGPGEN
jgi:DNA-binding CsgD family transcriptional regulator